MMLQFNKFVLENGLRVIVHEDASTPMAIVNVLYDVGAKDEDEKVTGFAHLFEHLMFGGSVNIPSYDEPLQRVGGENNAFTSNDITNYYIQLPANNIETAFWLESDRMLSLAFSEKSLDVQKNVVCEEFKQRYLNQPYGDVWLHLRPLVYQVHPYRWATIGKELSHIENANLKQVKAFFEKHYNPQNAILVVSGAVKTVHIRMLAEKWFAPIPSGNLYVRNLPQEPEQTKPKQLQIFANVPANAIYISFHAAARKTDAFYADDLMTDILSRGQSSRLYNRLMKEQRLFSDINAYSMGSLDNGLIVVEGKILPNVDIEQAEQAIWKELDLLKTIQVSEEELTKVKNKTESTMVFGEMNLMEKAFNLAYFELLGSADLFNDEIEKYLQVTSNDILEQARKVFRKENSSTLYYQRAENS